jgi:hypothetical protein
MVTDVKAVFLSFFLSFISKHTDDDGGENPLQRTIWYVRERERGGAGGSGGEKVVGR